MKNNTERITNERLIELISSKGKLYRHFKGGNHIYSIIGIGVNATNGPEDGTDVVIYQNVFDGHIYTRELNEFIFSEVPINRKDNITNQKYRFERIYDFPMENKENDIDDLIENCVRGIMLREGIADFEYENILDEVRTWDKEKIQGEIEFNEYLEDK